MFGELNRGVSQSVKLVDNFAGVADAVGVVRSILLNAGGIKDGDSAVAVYVSNGNVEVLYLNFDRILLNKGSVNSVNLAVGVYVANDVGRTCLFVIYNTYGVGR